MSRTHQKADRKAVSSIIDSDSRLISADVVRHLCGDISDMTLFRWLRRREYNFPDPVYITGRRYWRESEVVAWLKSLKAKKAAPPKPVSSVDQKQPKPSPKKEQLACHDRPMTHTEHRDRVAEMQGRLNEALMSANKAGLWAAVDVDRVDPSDPDGPPLYLVSATVLRPV